MGVKRSRTKWEGVATKRQYAMMLGNGYCVPVVSRILVGMIKATGLVRGGVRDPSWIEPACRGAKGFGTDQDAPGLTHCWHTPGRMPHHVNRPCRHVV